MICAIELRVNRQSRTEFLSKTPGAARTGDTFLVSHRKWQHYVIMSTSIQYIEIDQNENLDTNAETNPFNYNSNEPVSTMCCILMDVDGTVVNFVSCCDSDSTLFASRVDRQKSSNNLVGFKSSEEDWLDRKIALYGWGGANHLQLLLDQQESNLGNTFRTVFQQPYLWYSASKLSKCSRKNGFEKKFQEKWYFFKKYISSICREFRTDIIYSTIRLKQLTYSIVRKWEFIILIKVCAHFLGSCFMIYILWNNSASQKEKWNPTATKVA